MKRYKKTCLAAVLMLMVLFAGCSIVPTASQAGEVNKSEIAAPPLEFVSAHAKKLWEGDIEGRMTAYYRNNEKGPAEEVIVIVQDNLPGFFKRIEYLDEEGDGRLEVVKMIIYEEGKGWRDVGITRENKYGIEYADTRYKEVRGKIKEALSKGK